MGEEEMRKLLAGIRRNAILRFWSSYMLILVVMVITCFAGFQKAFSIVQSSMVEENEYSLRQGISRIDQTMTDIRVCGMKMALSEKLKYLGQMDSSKRLEYVSAASAMLEEYFEIVRYYNRELYTNTFIYVNNIDRILYDDAVYLRPVFQIYLDGWGISSEEWLAVCQGDETAPYFYVSDSGELFYVFPCLKSMQEMVRVGTVFFRIDEQQILEQMDFLERYSGYSLFVHQGEKCLVMHDGLACEEQIRQNRTEGLQMDGKIQLSVTSEQSEKLTYTVVIPEQEAMVRLSQLRTFIWTLLAIAAVAGTGISLFFSMRSGKPINRIADLLEESQVSGGERDLLSINRTVSEIIQEQQKNRPALQKTFFHNLLKADFLSRAEMEYMAARAGLQLSGGTYYAAAIRFFPQIEAENIDGQTVEEARAAQILTTERFEGEHGLTAWSYKRNTLETLFIIEIQEQERLLDILADIAMWLRDEHHIDACWGVGTSCRDLMYFWKSAEEANSVLSSGNMTDSVCLYSEIHLEDGSYWLPYSIQEHLVQGLRIGDYGAVESALEMIRTENCIRRSIHRKQFLKLNRDICELLAEQTRKWDDRDEELIRISSLISTNKEEYHQYFAQVKTLCAEICKRCAIQKNERRSEKIQAILQYMAENFQDPSMGLAMVSEQFKWSEGYLSSIFKEEMGVNFAEYLEQLRIEEACRLLKDGVLVAVVAERTGYNSVQSFRRAFKRVKEVSPSEYRS